MNCPGAFTVLAERQAFQRVQACKRANDSRESVRRGRETRTRSQHWTLEGAGKDKRGGDEKERKTGAAQGARRGES